MNNVKEILPDLLHYLQQQLILHLVNISIFFKKISVLKFNLILAFFSAK